MTTPFPREFREDVVRVAPSRKPEVTLAQIAKDFGSGEDGRAMSWVLGRVRQVFRCRDVRQLHPSLLRGEENWDRDAKDLCQSSQDLEAWIHWCARIRFTVFELAIGIGRNTSRVSYLFLRQSCLVTSTL